MTEKEELSTAFVFAGVVGGFAILGAVGAGYWWVAHHMAWWTFAAAFAGLTLGAEFLKLIVRDLRNAGRK